MLNIGVDFSSIFDCVLDIIWLIDCIQGASVLYGWLSILLFPLQYLIGVVSELLDLGLVIW